MVIVLYRTLLHEGPMSRDKLLSLVAPASVSEGGTMASSSLRRWTELGLFEESDRDVRITTDGRPSRDKAVAEASLASTMRRLVLRPENNANFWDAEGSASADFTRAVAWILAQDVYRHAFVGTSDVEVVEIAQVGGKERSLFQNDTRWPGFKAWAPFLGFGTLGRYPKSGVFQADPTVAVRDSLDAVFGKTRELAVSDFIGRLAEEVPVLDGGRYRVEVEAQLNRDAWEPPKELEVSTSLSRALIRLREAGVLRLEERSDSPARMELRLQGNRRWPVTHLLRKGGAS